MKIITFMYEFWILTSLFLILLNCKKIIRITEKEDDIMPKTVYIFRGIPGSGKSTIAAKLVGKSNVFEADQFFIKDGEYCHNPKLIKEAHAYCADCMEEACKNGVSPIAVANAATRLWEMSVYRHIADKYGYAVVELTVESDFSNVHEISQEKIFKMKDRFEHSFGHVVSN